MANVKNFSATIMMMVAMVMGFVFTSCENEEFSGYANEAELDFFLYREGEPVNNIYDWSLTAGERTHSVSYSCNGHAKLSEEEQNYNIFEEHRNLNVEYSNSKRSAGKPERVENADGSVNYVTKYTFPMEDGNIAYVDCSIQQRYVMFNGKMYALPTDSLINVELVSLANVTAAATTRAAEYYESDVVNTEIVAELTFTTTGLGNGNYTYTKKLRDVVTRHIWSKNDVEKAESVNVTREVIDANTERCSFEEVFTFKSGETESFSRSYVLNRNFKGIDTYNKNVDNFDFNLVKNGNVISGTTENSVESVQDGWTVFGRTDNYSSDLSNTVDNIATAYTFYHERCVYADEFITVEYPYVDVEVNETAADTHVANVTSDKKGMDKAILTNEIHTSYLGFDQDLNESVNLYKAEEVKIIDEGFDGKSAVKEISDSLITVKVDYIVYWSNNINDTTHFARTFARQLNPQSNWTVEANSNTQTTTGLVAKLVNSQKQNGKSNNNTATWNWVREQRSITSTVNLDGAAAQTNKWTAVDINTISVTYREHTFDFGTDEVSVSDNASVGAGVKEGDFDVYKYTDVLTYTFSSNVKKSSVPGTIKVANNTFFPKEWGKLLSAVETVARNEDHSTYVYVWSLHFEKAVLPVIVRKNATAPEFNFNYVEWTKESRYNSASYAKVNGSRTWVNTIASNEGDYMLWASADNKNVDSVPYDTASGSLNWDNGKVASNGLPTVFSNEHNLKVTSDGTLTSTLGSWK